VTSVVARQSRNDTSNASPVNGEGEMKQD